MKRKPTKEERKFFLALKGHQLSFQTQKVFYDETFACIADVFFRKDKTNIVVEIDGGYHCTESQKIKDEARTKFLQTNGCRVIRFTNEMVNNNIGYCLIELAKYYIELAVKPSYSRNYLIFCNIAGIGEKWVKKTNRVAQILETPDWGEREPLF